MAQSQVTHRIFEGELRFAVDVAPKAWARPRFTRDGRGYTPAEVTKHRNAIRLAALEARGAWEQRYSRTWPRFEGYDYRLFVTVYREARRGDWDNFAKQVDDALNGVLFADDRQVWAGFCTRIDRDDPLWTGEPRYEVHLEAYRIEIEKIRKPRKKADE